MGITQNTGASSLIKPGVIDNTAARPASPYEGQVVFQKDTDQLLVWNGTAWVIPNSPAQNPQGLEFITSGTLSGTTTQFQGCFTSTYDNYLILLDKIFFSAGADLYYNFMSGASVNSGAEYYWGFLGYAIDTTGKNSNASTGQTSGFTGITASVGNDILSSATLNVFGPTLSQRSLITSNAYSYPAQFAMRFGATHHNGSNQFTGIQFGTLTSATMGGRATIYGYRK